MPTSRPGKQCRRAVRCWLCDVGTGAAQLATVDHCPPCSSAGTPTRCATHWRATEECALCANHHSHQTWRLAGNGRATFIFGLSAARLDCQRVLRSLLAVPYDRRRRVEPNKELAGQRADRHPRIVAEQPRDADRRCSAARLDCRGVAAVQFRIGGEWQHGSDLEQLCTKRFTAASKAIAAAFPAERGREQCVARSPQNHRRSD
mmetsp:Transcript_4112/g.12770  ORF Transcript_4112/g.12770 Transcript_4112/m.12770 type:complete len:204 (+) Transcript_4112:255-866(+)